MNEYGSSFAGYDYGGMSPDEWRMFVFRARISGVNVITQLEAWRPYSKCEKVSTRTEEMWKPTDHFAENSRVRFNCSYLFGGMVSDGKMQGVRWYGGKGRESWVSDEELDLWRDKDYAEIQRREM